jgi:hypothetical protein
MSDSPAVIIYGDDGIGGYEEKGTTNPLKIDPSGTTAQPVTDNGSSLTVDDGGNSLTVDGPLTDAQLRATTVPVSTASLPLPTGAATETTISAINGKLPASVGQKAMAASLPVVVASDQSALPVSASALPLPTGAATSALQTTGNSSLSSIDTKTPALGQTTMANSQPVVIASNQSAVPVSGPLTDTQLRAIAVPVSDGGGSLTVDGPLTDAQLRAAAVPVSAASLPLPTGAATSALQTTGNTSVGNIDTKTPALGQATMAASTPVVIANNQSAVPVSGPLTDTQLRATAVPISDGGSSVTVDGPLTDTQLRATAVPVSASALPLPTGAATSALQTIGNSSLSSLDTKLPDKGQGTMANSTPVAIASDQNKAANTATLANVAGSASSVTLLAANTSRIIATIFNDSAAILYVKFGTTASTSSFTVRMVPNAYYEVPVGRDGRVYNGRIDGIWASATGNARVTEIT